MNLHKSPIDWCTHIWNPVTGCLIGCEYCYASGITSKRKPHANERPKNDEVCGTGLYAVPGTNPPIYYVTHPTRLVDETGQYIRSTPYPKGFAPTFNAYTLKYPEKRFIPSLVLVSNMGDLFGDWVPTDWIEAVFDSCKRAPHHTYLFLTRNPERYADLGYVDGILPCDSNFWYGASVTNAEEMEKAADAFGRLPVKLNTFLCLDPMMDDLAASPGWTYANDGQYAKWLIIGAMTGSGSRKHQPKREWVEAVVAAADDGGIPVFMRNSLKDVWGPDLIQKHPAGMLWPEDKSDG